MRALLRRPARPVVAEGAAPSRSLAVLTLLAVVLGLLSAVLLATAVLMALQAADVRNQSASLPLDQPVHVPAWHLVVPVLFGIASVTVAMVAAELRIGVQILARDRESRLPRLRHLPTALPELPPLALPDAAELVGATLRLTVLVPAHNEESIITDALQALLDQTRPPDRIVVVADNCSDRTVELALAAGAEVQASVANTEKKAGALNQALEVILPTCSVTDVVMIMDADTLLAPGFLEAALDRLEGDPDLVAVGGIFHGEDGQGLVGQLQRNEYTRYGRYIARKRGKVFVLTGTASLIRAYALRAVADARGTLLPGPPGRVYDTVALTEDNELTLALKTLGATMVSPSECTNVTEVMQDWTSLWRQRSRWQRGALENLGCYGLTRTTALYWAQQIGIGWGVVALNSYFLLMTITLLAADSFVMSTFWACIGLIFMVERVVTAWGAGWRGRLLAALIFVELAYDLFLQAVYVKSLFDIATGQSKSWNVVVREPAPTEPFTEPLTQPLTQPLTEPLAEAGA